MSISNKAVGYLSTGSLLGDLLDTLYLYGQNVRTVFGFKDTNTATKIQDSTAIDLLEQNLSLNVTTLASARRAAKLMMPRLAPMPIEKLVWDIVGPNKDRDDAEGKYTYTLGFLRSEDLTKLGGELQNIKSRNGHSFSFINDARLITKRKKMLLQLLGATACYCALLWAGFSWGERPSHITQNWQSEARELSLETTRAQNASEVLNNQSDLIQSYQAGTANMPSIDVLSILAIAAQTLPDTGWIQQFDLSGRKIRMNGLTDDAAKFAAKLETQSTIARIELGVVTADRATGLQRFALTIFLVEA